MIGLKVSDDITYVIKSTKMIKCLNLKRFVTVKFILSSIYHRLNFSIMMLVSLWFSINELHTSNIFVGHRAFPLLQ